jgi:hypothetical protein
VPAPGIGSFHVHRGHEFEGFQIVERDGSALLVARCSCGAVLDVTDAAFEPCPDCEGRADCARCGGTGRVIDHTALVWRLPDETEDRDADNAER